MGGGGGEVLKSRVSVVSSCLNAFVFSVSSKIKILNGVKVMIQIISQTPSVMLNYESLAHYLIGSVHQHLGFSHPKNNYVPSICSSNGYMMLGVLKIIFLCSSRMMMN